MLQELLLSEVKQGQFNQIAHKYLDLPQLKLLEECMFFLTGAINLNILQYIL